jgi:hypothetical protein
VAVTDAGGGQADITIGQKWLIASHSGSFTEEAFQNSSIYWVGDRDCGWDSCSLTLAAGLGKERVDPIPSVFSNVLIPSPWYIYNGDVLEVCGIAHCGSADNNYAFGAALGRVSCAEIAQTGEGYPALLASGSDQFTNNNSTCFNLVWTSDGTYEPCDTLFELGFHVLNLPVSDLVKFSYTFKLTRGCTF